MGSKWTFKSLNELGVQLIDCMHKTPSAQVTGVPYIGIPQMKNGEIDFEASPRLISESDYKLWTEKANPQYGDIILSRRCNPGETAFVSGQTQFALGQNLVILRTNGLSITAEYLRWALNSSYWWDEVEKYKNPGAIFDSLKCGDIPNFQIPAPPLRIQNKISSVLDLLTDRINLSNKVNKTLEQISQTLFKSWFVDFDPVIDNALDAGNPIPEALQSRAELRQKVRNSENFKPLPADIRILFPAEFEEMALGLIPKGWKFSNVNSLLKNTIGGDWGSDSEDEKHTTQAVIVRGTDIPELISGKLSSAPYRWVEPKKLEKRRINVGDIIIEVSGGSPTQSTGRSIFMTEQIIDRLGGVIEPASFCRKFEPLSVELGLIISLHLSKIYNDGKMWEYQNQSTGIANFQTKYFLEAEQIVIPSVQVINAFYRIVMPWIEKSHNNEQIILGNLRDTLLPKLISGELSLEDLPDLVTQTEPA
ncbi:restriction endonuclease subunit S [Klebsiella quasipneumoniae]|uniref:restriction endonuclease subunit S n=1 Tax=Klebsiella quasipneumoniae TaxID=1463165 RepID=UPI003D07C859